MSQYKGLDPINNPIAAAIRALGEKRIAPRLARFRQEYPDEKELADGLEASLRAAWADAAQQIIAYLDATATGTPTLPIDIAGYHLDRVDSSPEDELLRSLLFSDDYATSSH